MTVSKSEKFGRDLGEDQDQTENWRLNPRPDPSRGCEIFHTMPQSVLYPRMKISGQRKDPTPIWLFLLIRLIFLNIGVQKFPPRTPWIKSYGQKGHFTPGFLKLVHPWRHKGLTLNQLSLSWDQPFSRILKSAHQPTLHLSSSPAKQHTTPVHHQASGTSN